MERGRRIGSHGGQARPQGQKVRVGVMNAPQVGSGSIDRSAVSPWTFAQEAKNAARRGEMIPGSLQVHPSTRHARRAARSVAVWRSNLMSIALLRSWVETDTPVSMVQR
jgi:hypothetical protein